MVSLTCLSWHADGPPPLAGGAPGRTAVQGPGAAAAIGAAVLAVVTVAWLGLSTLPSRPAVARTPSAKALLGLASGTLALVALKLAADTDGLARGAWISLLLTAALAAVRAKEARRAPDQDVRT